MSTSSPPPVDLTGNNDPSAQHEAVPTITAAAMPVQSSAIATAASGPDPAELSFLVTHWLSSFTVPTTSPADHDNDWEQQEAVAKIRRAAADMASAFGTLGAFGTVNRPRLASQDFVSLQSDAPDRKATYADLKRKWSSTCPPSQLANLVRAASAAAETADCAAARETAVNLMQQATETVTKSRRNRSGEAGRTLGEAIPVGDAAAAGIDEMTDAIVPTVASSLQPPVLLESSSAQAGTNMGTRGTVTSTTATGGVAADKESLNAKLANLTAHSADTVRHFLNQRTIFRKEESQTQSLKDSLALQENTWSELQQQKSHLEAQNGALDPPEKLAMMDSIQESEQNCTRVMATLQRQLQNREPIHILEGGVVTAEAAARQSFAETKEVLANYRNASTDNRLVLSKNRVLFNLVNRQLGIDRMGGRGVPRSMGRLRTTCLPSETRKALLFSRLSHAATVNTHLSYPVYCLKFDRTGQYFATGADDYLVKVFCVGGSIASTRSSTRPSTFARGPVLIYTLRGHAGVINDIDVSCDNSFLATASEDGDCRVWGLKDGRPVAILRGHVGGANMVAWSKLTPYRLVTTGADGLARTWDIREASLKRYGAVIGKRPEYRHREQGSTRSSGNNSADTAIRSASVRHNNGEDANTAGAEQQAAAVALPPLPPAAAGNPPPAAVPVAAAAAVGPNQAAGQGDQNEINPGGFVANDSIDEGVKLLAKLQHGAVLDEQARGPGTRSRRLAVKVICVVRCPHGGHFATGSDDGICRVWQDEEDPAVKKTDELLSDKPFVSPALFGGTEKPHRSPPMTRFSHQSDRLLLTLKGHLSAITDLQYSNAGDRILTASQKDGVVRVWSWDFNRTPSSTLLSPSTRDASGGQASHILIKLTNPNSSSSSNGQATGRRPRRSTTSLISCDVAAWLPDDTKVVTSQCELVKQSSSEIVAGSQFIFLWDSLTGHCLLGIPEAHNMQCPVVIPHPTDASILCTAGADGLVKLWDLETGRCTFSHENIVDFGPVEANERGKVSGYLEGSFFADGTGLVLTDDSGRVSVFDTLVPKGSNGEEAATWMKEQYFANDYYELFYDSHGYCIERGSEQPPHLAPRGVRCSHSGAPWSDGVNEMFKKLSGPLPISVSDARSSRQVLRARAHTANERHSSLRGNVVGQYDPLATILIRHGKGSTGSTPLLEANEQVASNEVPQASGSGNTTARASANSNLSSNYRWRDYGDLQDDEGNDDDEPDSDDEEFQLTERRRGPGRSLLNESDSEDDEEMEAEQMVPPPRASDRDRSADYRRYSEYYSSEDENVEFMSTNNAPSGPFVPDYDAHFFRMSGSAKVHRQWLHRMESNSSYGGRKSYTPQVGDSVVYIPRAHYETISEFPSLPAPWQSWPQEAVWPVVRCCIRSIRYRFPYKAYYSSQNNGGNVCKSVVAVLFLEVTGIPQLSHDRTFDWPNPSFFSSETWRGHTFELSVFENDQTDFIIPMGLYTARLQSLESALRNRDTTADLVGIEAYYADEGAPDDSEFLPFQGLVREHFNDDENNAFNDLNLCGSGYRSLTIEWEDGTTDNVSPWEVNISSASGTACLEPDRPSLTDEEKKTVRDALHHVKSLPCVDQYFLIAVDENRYSDYRSRVEVPMDLTFVTNRLEADYYATRVNVVADVKLIAQNSAKYNGAKDELTEFADDIAGQFEELVLADTEREAYRDFDAAVIFNLPRRDAPVQDNEIPVETRLSLRSTRNRRPAQARSSLESLPAPLAARSRRSGVERGRTSARRSRVDRPTRSVLEPASADGRAQRRAARASERQLPGVEQGPQRARRLGHAPPQQPERQARTSSRSRTLRGDTVVDSTSRPQRQSTRAPTRDGIYADQPSDFDESELGSPQQPERRTRASSRSRAIRGNSAAESPPRQQRNSARTASRGGSYVDQPSDVEVEKSSPPGLSDEDSGDHVEEQQPASKPRCPLPRTATHPIRRNRRSKQDEDSDLESPQESESEEEVVPSDNGDDLDSSIEARKRTSPRSRNRKRSMSVDSPRRSSGRTSRQKAYADPSSSECDSDVEKVAKPPARLRERTNKSASKRPKHDSPDSRPSKKKKRNAAPVTSPRQPVKVWPDINIKSITKVTNTILSRLGDLDEENIFAEPVADAYPAVARAYNKAIANPMDFQTIEEERLQVYQSISELQQDLVLVFGNCITFNQDDSKFGQLALLMLESIDGIFRDVCNELDVRLPRRW